MALERFAFGKIIKKGRLKKERFIPKFQIYSKVEIIKKLWVKLRKKKITIIT